MKKILIKAFLTLSLGTAVVSCSNNPGSTEPVKDSTNAFTNTTQFQKEWDQYFAKPPIKANIGLDQPVDSIVARHCIDSLQDLLQINPDLKRIYHAYTESVWFGGSNLKNWFMDNHVFENTVIAFRLGIYTQEAYLKYKDQGLKPENRGRITVFIWPYNIDPVTKITTTPTNPYNIGGIHP